MPIKKVNITNEKKVLSNLINIEKIKIIFSKTF